MPHNSHVLHCRSFLSGLLLLQIGCGGRSPLDGTLVGIGGAAGTGGESILGGAYAAGGVKAAGGKSNGGNAGGGAKAVGGTANSITHCNIDTAYYASDSANPNNPCQSCQPSQSTSAWTDIPMARCTRYITAGSNHTCALHNNTVYCWGLNDHGQLGHDSNSSCGSNLPCSLTPIQVQNLDNGVTGLTGGDSHSCAIVNGAAYCWGSNPSGQLGNGALVDSTFPVQAVGLTASVQSISAGDQHTCALVGGVAYCWGDNQYGQLGNGTTTSSTAPTPVKSLSTTVTAVVA